jgi:hypothetical protein
MIIETPKQSDIVLKYLDSENKLDWPITKRYPGYEKCFLAFHPFLITKNDGDDIISMKSYPNKPDKKEIIKNYNKLTWTEFLKLSNIIGYKELDDVISFYHRARRNANKFEHEKFNDTIENDKLGIIAPDVDYLPEIIEDDLLNFILKKNYEKIYLIDEFTEEKILHNTNDLFKEELNKIHCIRINTPDNKLFIVEDYDRRFTYFLGDEILIKDLIIDLDLEGFYCDEFTTDVWSYDIIPESVSLTWDQDMERINSKKLTN